MIAKCELQNLLNFKMNNAIARYHLHYSEAWLWFISWGLSRAVHDTTTHGVYRVGGIILYDIFCRTADKDKETSRD